MMKTLRYLLIFSLLFENAGWAADATPPAVAASTSTATSSASSAKEPMIEVSVDTLEISETNRKNVGVSWGQSGGSNQNTSQPILDANHLNVTEAAIPAIFDAGKFTRSALFGQIQALIQNNQARVLANPTLLTKSGFEANFVVGGEIPYPTIGQGGVGGVEFKKYGVILKILPQITPRQTIDAQINVAVTNPDSSVAIVLNGTSVPGLSSREAASKVEVNDGETVVLAGIKQSTRNKVVSRVPILGAIPLLGLLFRSTTENVTQTSLVLFVTFRKVK
jgi:pilus assembly protein CpaC